MTLRAAPILAALIVFVSGCVDSSSSEGPAADSTEAPPPSVTADTGSIEGVLVDEEGQPVQAATVALVELDLQTKSDDAGKFVFNELTPGTFKLLAERLGYQSIAKSVDVKAGEITQARFVMSAIEILDEGFFRMTQYDGLVQCSVSIFTPINPCGGVTGEDKDSWIFTIDRNLTFKEGIFELVWKATGPEPIGKHMELEVCDDLNREYLCTFGGTTSDYYKWADGESPQVLRLTDLPKNKNQFLTGAGAAFEQAPLIQQKFTIYMTHCFLEECAEDYQARPPG